MKKVLIITSVSIIFFSGCATTKTAKQQQSKLVLPAVEKKINVEDLLKLSSSELNKKITELFNLSSSGDNKYFGTDAQKQAKEKLVALQGKAVLFLIEKLDSNDVREILTSMELMPMIGKPCVEPLISILNDSSPVRVSRGIYVLSLIGDRKAVEPVFSMLSYKNPKIRAAAITAMGKFNEMKSIPAIINALNDNYPGVVRRAIVVLGDFKEVKAIPHLIKLLNDERFSIRYPAAASLVKIGSPSVDLLIKSLCPCNLQPLAKYQMIDCLGKIKDKRAVDPLINLLCDCDWAIRAFAVEALFNINDKKGIDAIKELSKSETHPFVIEKINSAVKR